MPYCGPDDSLLPSNVQALSVSARRQWVSVFNSAYNNCRSSQRGGGAGSEQTCEGMAFRMANGVIRKHSGKALSALKEGRVLSAANMRSMVEALRAMVAVMRKAGFEMEHMEGSKGGPGSGPRR